MAVHTERDSCVSVPEMPLDLEYRAAATNKSEAAVCRNAWGIIEGNFWPFVSASATDIVHQEYPTRGRGGGEREAAPRWGVHTSAVGVLSAIWGKRDNVFRHRYNTRSASLGCRSDDDFGDFTARPHTANSGGVAFEINIAPVV